MLDPKSLVELAWYKMPYGKYKGQFLSDIPEPYYIWYRRKGFPDGKLGRYLQTVCDMKVEGIEYLLKDIRKNTINDH
ncbi:DUF3820 family protein [Nonlabens ponticola]|uniref:DUF3820 family protein n=1 Tax=Nonlabens ponticola TaxID=2496866 RepID=A0A3S9MU66_9FLAO|nr:DUF3820 family protein [Nonlabens ponticola]AZQ42703.1 hypothetical protein EJ995_00015 [Nonlabens ponticola]